MHAKIHAVVTVVALILVTLGNETKIGLALVMLCCTRQVVQVQTIAEAVAVTCIEIGLERARSVVFAYLFLI